MERISIEEQYARIAKVIAMRGSCGRLKVGAVVVKNNRPISTGYNGPLHKLDECSEHSCNLTKPCERAIHAEANAIYACTRAGISTSGATIYCTALPCLKCAEAIIQSGIDKVYYLEEFRDDSAIRLFNLYKVKVTKLVWNAEDKIDSI